MNIDSYTPVPVGEGCMCRLGVFCQGRQETMCLLALIGLLLLLLQLQLLLRLWWHAFL